MADTNPFWTVPDYLNTPIEDPRIYPGRDTSVSITDLTLTTRGGKLKVFEQNALVQFNIYEDIFQNCTTGNISVIDANGWFEEFPICGDETLTVSFKTSEEYPGSYYTKAFTV